jgi:transcriptional antiterminator RfaH
MGQWYTLHTKPNSEYQVETALRERGFQTYLPQITSPRPQRRSTDEPFFPCYLFIKVDLGTVALSEVQSTPGLRSIVGFDGQLISLTDEIIDMIRRRLNRGATAGAYPGYVFKQGDTVRITDGPFQDMLAIFDGPAMPAERVQVLLDILGRASRVQVAVTDLEEVVAEAEVPASKRPRGTRGRGRRINYKH